jgi:hypothetical protein
MTQGGRAHLICANWSINTALVLLIVTGSAAAQTREPAPFASAPDPPKEAPPQPAETNWRSLVKDTGRDFASFPRRRSTWVLLAAGGAMALAVHPADDYIEEHIVGDPVAKKIFAAGKVIGSAPFQVGAAVGLWVLGRYVVPPEDNSTTSRMAHIGFDLMRAQIVTESFVYGIKYSVQRDRPTGECCSFPSGHAAGAFAAASVLERHFGYRASWPALVGASYVAMSRLVDNRHFLSDVVFGAALGEATGWTVVGRHGKSSYALQPVPIRGGIMVALVRRSDEQ